MSETLLSNLEVLVGMLIACSVLSIIVLLLRICINSALLIEKYDNPKEITDKEVVECKYLYKGLALDYEHYTACMLRDIKKSIILKGGVDDES